MPKRRWRKEVGAGAGAARGEDTAEGQMRGTGKKGRREMTMRREAEMREARRIEEKERRRRGGEMGLGSAIGRLWQ